ncbi:PhnD/SsuA/transferrin family substrate-binding protein [Paenibacillus sp. SC116]|uniref:substrate-binding domain-containing protein n=1 Tax=Paenibacillus sp. SC116 TaxID=2968986 RepID=UPI00215A5C7B|nr:PhnD/SsuA/transferrin family substrate-binding protein [Paenibacillus sp. SC116]
MNKCISVLLICVMTILLVSCQPTHSDYQIDFTKSESAPIQSHEGKHDPIRVTFSSLLAPSDTIVHYRKIANYIGEQMQRPVILIQRKSYREMSMLVINGGADIALLSAGAYLTFRDVETLEPIAVQERMGVPYYQGYLVVNNAREDIDHITDLIGKSIAFTDPLSYSGYQFVQHKLAEMNETPEQFFGRSLFTHNHEHSLRAVIDNVVTAAAVNNLVFEQALQKQPELSKKLKVIDKSKRLGTGPVVVNRNLSDLEKDQIEHIFLTMHENEKLKAALKGLSIDRFVPVDPALFEITDSSSDSGGGRR